MPMRCWALISNVELVLVEKLLNQTLDNPVELIADVIEEMPLRADAG